MHCAGRALYAVLGRSKRRSSAFRLSWPLQGVLRGVLRGCPRAVAPGQLPPGSCPSFSRHCALRTAQLPKRLRLRLRLQLRLRLRLQPGALRPGVYTGPHWDMGPCGWVVRCRLCVRATVLRACPGRALGVRPRLWPVATATGLFRLGEIAVSVRRDCATRLCGCVCATRLWDAIVRLCLCGAPWSGHCAPVSACLPREICTGHWALGTGHWALGH